MNQQQTKLHDHFVELVQAGLGYQRLRLTNIWEPSLTAKLANMAPICGKKLMNALGDDPRMPWNNERHYMLMQVVSSELPPVFAVRLEDFCRTIKQMVEQEFYDTAEALTLNGLLREMPALGLSEGERAAAVEDLAGTRAVRHLAGRHFVAFRGGVESTSLQTFSANHATSVLKERINRATRLWTGRLKTLGVTAVHSAANNVRFAVHAKV